MNKAAWILFGVLVSTLSAMSSSAVAQDNYPSALIKVVVAGTPAGLLDTVARLLAQKLSTQMGATVIVENRAGDNGNLGAEYVAKSKPDGYTLLANSSSLVFSRAYGEKIGYDLLTDLTPISLATSSPQVLVVHPSVPSNTLAEFMAHLKANPGKLAYGSTGTGSLVHLAFLFWLQPNGLTALHVPYKGGALMMTSLLGGEIQFTMQGANALPLIKDKRVKALATAALKRAPLLPDVPTFAETGMPLEVTSWQAIMVPAKTPPAIVKRLNGEILRALQDPNIKSRVVQEFADMIASSPEEYGAFLKTELERWTKVIRSNGIKPE